MGAVRMEQNRPVHGEMLTVQELAGCVEAGAVHANLPVQVVSAGLRDILLPMAYRRELAALAPDLEAMKALSRARDVTGIHAFALSEEAGDTACCRSFAPLVGIGEESATGTSSCALACYLAAHGLRRDRRRVCRRSRVLGL